MAPEEVRRHNYLRSRPAPPPGPMSRSELAQKTGPNRSTIADHISELSRLGLSREARHGLRRARPSYPVVSPARGATVLAVEFSVDSRPSPPSGWAVTLREGRAGPGRGTTRSTRRSKGGPHGLPSLDDFAEDQVLV